MAEVSEIVIPDFVQEYLEPIPGGSPAGVDAANEEEYFKLNMEIQKTTPDYKKCIELCDIILKEKSKDIKVSCWLCFALFRTEKIKGLKNGLNILYYLLNKFENNLFPPNESHRSKAIQFLNTPRFFKLIERETIDKSNADDIIEADKILSQIIIENEKLFPSNVPVLKSFIEAVKMHVEAAEALNTPAKKEEPKTSTVERNHVQQNASAVKPIAKPPASTVSSDINITSEKDAIIQLRKLLLYFFEDNSEGNKKEIVPESSFIFGLSRQFQWGRIFRPLDVDKVTQIEAPNQIIQAKIKEYYSTNNWDALIPRIEINFLKPESEFIYWFDAQRFVTKALEQKGGSYLQAANEIKIQIASLLKRIPDLHLLKYKDKQTPFADKETLKWLDEIKLSSADGSEDGKAFILPPIMGEEYDSINKEYEKACNDQPEKFEENLALMQNQILNDQRIKGRFLRRLCLANYCFHAKHFNIAKINLLELQKLINEYNLTEWEPALCTAVWESMYIINSEIIAGLKKDDTSEIEKEQKDLLYKITKYDGLLAIKLLNKYK